MYGGKKVDFYLSIIGKCMMCYVIIVIALRVMGKREVGELSIFDIVIFLLMSEILAISIESDGSIFRSLIPIATLAILQIVFSIITLKSKSIRELIDGKPVILIHDGHVFQKRMQKERYTIDDMMTQIREMQLSTPDEVAFAVLENKGTLSVVAKKDCKSKHPFPIVSDGLINHSALTDLGKDEDWLKREFKREGIDEVEDVFLAMYLKNGWYILKKEAGSTNSMKQWVRALKHFKS